MAIGSVSLNTCFFVHDSNRCSNGPLNIVQTCTISHFTPCFAVRNKWWWVLNSIHWDSGLIVWLDYPLSLCEACPILNTSPKGKYQVNQPATAMTNPNSITIPRRLVGVGTMLLGAFAMYYCISFLADLWSTPQRTVAIVVTVISGSVVFLGAVIGFPDFLPSKIVAISMFLFGILIMAVGSSILAWFAYNVLVARQEEFVMGKPSFAFTMVIVGAGIAFKGFSTFKTPVKN